MTRVWGEVATPIGLLKFGRMGDQFGLGIVHNDGNCLDCDYGVTVDRFEFVAEPLPGFLVVHHADFDVEGLVSGSIDTQGQPYDVTNTDDSHTFGIILARKDTEQKARAKIDAGGTVFNYGLFFQYRSQTYEYKQNGDTTASRSRTRTRSRRPSLSRVPRRVPLHPGPVVEARSARRSASSSRSPPTSARRRLPALQRRHERGNVRLHQQLTIAQYGGALQTEWRLLEGALKIGLEVGAASGDSAPGFGNKPNGPSGQVPPTVPPTTGAQWGDYDGAQYGQRPSVTAPLTQPPICIDNDIRNFRFNQDYRIDLILWQEIIGGITDALYVAPGSLLAFNDSLSVFGALIYSTALKPTSTPSGTSTQLGFEINAGVRYQTDDGFYAQLAYGILFPFDGLQVQLREPLLGHRAPPDRPGGSCPARDPFLGRAASSPSSCTLPPAASAPTTLRSPSPAPAASAPPLPPRRFRPRARRPPARNARRPAVARSAASATGPTPGS